MYCPCLRFMSKTMRMFSDRSSKYHSLMSPLIWRAFLLPLTSVSALSATAIKRMPQKQRVDVLFYQFHVAGKAGLALAEDNLELLFFRRFNHAVEVRPQTVRAGVILIAVNVVDVPPPLYGVTDEQRFLILDAFRFRLPFVFVLLTQSCINRTKDSYTSFKA